MKVTLDRKLRVNIEGIDPDELGSFMKMVRGASLQERRVWFPVLRELEKSRWLNCLSLIASYWLKR